MAGAANDHDPRVGIALCVLDGPEDFADAARRQRVVLFRAAEGDAAYVADQIDRDGGVALGHGVLGTSVPATSRDFMTLPLSLRGSVSTTVI